MTYGYMHINETATMHLAAVENLHVRERSGVENLHVRERRRVEETPLNPVPFICLIGKTALQNHKILLHCPRADVYYSSVGVKYCRHVSCSRRRVLSPFRLVGMVGRVERHVDYSLLLPKFVVCGSAGAGCSCIRRMMFLQSYLLLSA